MHECGCPIAELYARAAKERDKLRAEVEWLREELAQYKKGGVIAWKKEE